jgi:hypothetical protein
LKGQGRGDFWRAAAFEEVTISLCFVVFRKVAASLRLVSLRLEGWEEKALTAAYLVASPTWAAYQLSRLVKSGSVQWALFHRMNAPRAARSKRSFFKGGNSFFILNLATIRQVLFELQRNEWSENEWVLVVSIREMMLSETLQIATSAEV